ncbi:MAG: NADH-quinone oxidoreductase subunit B [Candidatus Nanopelagicales bacterium]
MDAIVDGRTVRIVPLRLACCAVELDEGLRRIDSAAGAGVQAHVLVVAGTVTHVTLPDVVAAFEELPEPRAAVAFGACTLSGGPYWDSYSVVPGLRDALPGAIEVAGCPPRPEAVPSAIREAVVGLLGEAP